MKCHHQVVGTLVPLLGLALKPLLVTLQALLASSLVALQALLASLPVALQALPVSLPVALASPYSLETCSFLSEASTEDPILHHPTPPGICGMDLYV